MLTLSSCEDCQPGLRDIQARPCDALVLMSLARPAGPGALFGLPLRALGPALHPMFGIDLDQPGPDDIAQARELLERVGYDGSGMSDGEALDVIRSLLVKPRTRVGRPGST